MAIGKISVGATVAILLTAIIVTLTTLGAITVNQTLPSTGTITTVNVGVYSDSACTQSLTSINWGTISPGGTVTQTIYVKNTGNTAITLSMTKSSWNPTSANGPITIAWNREGTNLNPGAQTTATLTLNVASSISGISSFSVNIVIAGTGG
jgi:hypothetical protein